MSGQSNRLTLAIGMLLAGVPTINGHEARAQDLLSVIEYRCAFEINLATKNPEKEIACDGIRQPGPIFIWMRLSGGEKALSRLENGQGIGLRHKWVRNIGRDAEVIVERVLDPLPAGSINADKIESLRREVTERGFFDWRTWTRRYSIAPSAYEIFVTDPTLQVIACPPQPSSAVCSVAINVQ